MHGQGVHEVVPCHSAGGPREIHLHGCPGITIGWHAFIPYALLGSSKVQSSTHSQIFFEAQLSADSPPGQVLSGSLDLASLRQSASSTCTYGMKRERKYRSGGMNLIPAEADDAMIYHRYWRSKCDSVLNLFEPSISFVSATQFRFRHTQL